MSLQSQYVGRTLAITLLGSICLEFQGCPQRVIPNSTDKDPPSVLVSFSDAQGKTLATTGAAGPPITIRYPLLDIHSQKPFTVQFWFQDQGSGIKYTQPFISWKTNPGTHVDADTQGTNLPGPPFPVNAFVKFDRELKEGYTTYTYYAEAIDGNGNRLDSPTVTVEVVHP